MPGGSCSAAAAGVAALADTAAEGAGGEAVEAPDGPEEAPAALDATTAPDVEVDAEAGRFDGDGAAERIAAGVPTTEPGAQIADVSSDSAASGKLRRDVMVPPSSSCRVPGCYFSTGRNGNETPQ